MKMVTWARINLTDTERYALRELSGQGEAIDNTVADKDSRLSLMRACAISKVIGGDDSTRAAVRRACTKAKRTERGE